MIKVIIAEDHAVVRRGLSQIIRERDHMTLVKEAVDGTCRAQDDARNRLGYFLLDITLPLRNGLEVLHESRRVLSSSASADSQCVS